MSNVPKSLTDSSLTLFKLTISASDPWPFSLVIVTFWFEKKKTRLVFEGFSASGCFEMGSGEKHHHLSFHLNMPHHHHHHHHQEKEELKDIPKGCLAIMVGPGEERQRIVVPVAYFKHPLFIQLLKEAEEEYGFDHKGPIIIPCNVEQFRQVKGMIDEDNSDHHHHHHHQHNHHHHGWCFKEWSKFLQIVCDLVVYMYLFFVFLFFSLFLDFLSHTND